MLWHRFQNQNFITYKKGCLTSNLGFQNVGPLLFVYRGVIVKKFVLQKKICLKKNRYCKKKFLKSLFRKKIILPNMIASHCTSQCSGSSSGYHIDQTHSLIDNTSYIERHFIWNYMEYPLTHQNLMWSFENLLTVIFSYIYIFTLVMFSVMCSFCLWSPLYSTDHSRISALLNLKVFIKVPASCVLAIRAESLNSDGVETDIELLTYFVMNKPRILKKKG